MHPSRRSQPYARGQAREPGPALGAMMRGAPLHSPNPMDVQRRAQKGAKRPSKAPSAPVSAPQGDSLLVRLLLGL